MNSDPLIRAARPEDATGLKQCMISAYSFYEQRMDGLRLPPMDADYEDEIKHYPTWVVEREGVIAGGLTMMFEDDKATLANIAINPEFQGLGIGGKLMRFAESLTIEKNYTELYLATHERLHENLSLYTHLGWVETERGNAKVSMKKTLTK